MNSGLSEITEIGRQTFYRARFKYTGSQDFTYITWDIVHEKDQYRIEQMYDQRNLNALF